MLRDNLIKEDKVKLFLDDCYVKIKKQKKLAIWGCGRGGSKLIEFMKRSNLLDNLEDCIFLDNDATKCGKLFCDRKVIYPGQIVHSYMDYYIIITCADSASVIKQLQDIGVNTEKQVELMDFAWINFDTSDYEYIYSNIDKFEYAYNNLADVRSKEVFESILNYKITKNPYYTESVNDGFEKEYFDLNVIKIKNDAIFFDAGSYIGDTALAFNKAVQGGYEKIICVEPDKSNYSKLLKTIKNNDLKNVESYNVGLYDKKGYLHFDNETNGGAASCHISDTGTTNIEVNTVDNILNGQKVDLIKMDIEGAEYNALLGARLTIEKYKPTLIICVYHKPDDFFKLTELIKQLNNNYNLYFRHYSLTDFETVCYAIDEN